MRPETLRPRSAPRRNSKILIGTGIAALLALALPAGSGRAEAAHCGVSAAAGLERAAGAAEIAVNRPE